MCREVKPCSDSASASAFMQALTLWNGSENHFFKHQCYRHHLLSVDAFAATNKLKLKTIFGVNTIASNFALPLCRVYYGVSMSTCATQFQTNLMRHCEIHVVVS